MEAQKFIKVGVGDQSEVPKIFDKLFWKPSRWKIWKVFAYVIFFFFL